MPSLDASVLSEYKNWIYLSALLGGSIGGGSAPLLRHSRVGCAVMGSSLSAGACVVVLACGDRPADRLRQCPNVGLPLAQAWDMVAACAPQQTHGVALRCLVPWEELSGVSRKTSVLVLRRGPMRVYWAARDFAIENRVLEVDLKMHYCRMLFHDLCLLHSHSLGQFLRLFLQGTHSSWLVADRGEIVALLTNDSEQSVEIECDKDGDLTLQARGPRMRMKKTLLIAYEVRENDCVWFLDQLNVLFPQPQEGDTAEQNGAGTLQNRGR
jgi:hypothetical protein